MALSNFFKSLIASLVYAILAIAAVSGIIALALRLIPKKNPAKLKNVSISLPFGIGGIQWDVVPPIEQKLAWSLYVELVTRIALQPLAPDQGYLREALNSLYNLFTTTRQILKEVDPAVAISPNSMGEIAIEVLNKGLRPFLTKWHPILEDWEAKRPDGVSRLQHEKDWSQATECRQELNSLRQGLEQYAQGLAKIAGIAL